MPHLLLTAGLDFKLGEDEHHGSPMVALKDPIVGQMQRGCNTALAQWPNIKVQLIILSI